MKTIEETVATPVPCPVCGVDTILVRQAAARGWRCQLWCFACWRPPRPGEWEEDVIDVLDLPEIPPDLE